MSRGCLGIRIGVMGRQLNDLVTDQAAWSAVCAARSPACPGPERAVATRLNQPGVHVVAAKYPTLTALRASRKAQVQR